MMTDEKKAERYVSPEIWGDKYYINQCGDWTNEDMKKAHLDGLKEGRKEKWHDLRKDPNDLPKKDGQYWCYVDNECFDNHGFVHFCNEEWACKYTQVIAWCELPKFEEMVI